MVNNMSHKLSHTTIRGGTYYTNFRIKDSSQMVRISLGTDSFKQAEAMMNRVRSFIPFVQRGEMSVDDFKSRLNGMRELTREGLNKLLLNVLEITIEDADFSSSNPRFYNSTQPLDVQAKYAKSMADAMRSKVMGMDSKEASELWGLDKEYVISEELKPLLLENAKKVAYFHDLQFQAISAMSSGDAPRYEQIMDIFSKEKTRITETNTPSCPVLSEVWASYVKDKGSKWRKPIANENQRFMDVLFHVVGDVPVNQITKQHIFQSCDLVKNLPVRIKLPYSRMSLQECIEFDVPEEDLVASEHVHKHLKLWRRLFKTYLVERREILVKSPTDGVTFKVEPNRGGSYSPRELEKIKAKLNGLSDDDYQKWYFLTLLFTGARRSEIADLQKKNFKRDVESGRYYFCIEKGKTQHAKRNIPIHKKLEAYFVKKVEELNDMQLIFGNLPNYTTITDDWISIMRELDIPDFNESGFKRRVHSLRHSFISRSVGKTGNTPLMQHVVGHSRKKDLNVSANYLHPTIGELAIIVDSIE